MGAIKNAFKAIAKGVEKAVHGAAQFAKGMATLNLKAAAQGLKEIAHAGTDIARGVINLTPAALAANTLLDGALDKMLKKASKVVDKVATNPNRTEETVPYEDKVRLPDEFAGHVMVFRTYDKVSYGLVMDTIKPVRVGYELKHPDAPY